MKIQYLPAMRVDFVPQEGPGSRLPVTVYRPYGVLQMDELLMRAQRDERGALLEAAERYYFGLGVDKDPDKALSYLLRAADRDVQDAAYLIAECYRNGIAVEQDEKKCVEWLFRAAENGSWMAMLNLAAVYHTGSAADGNAELTADETEAFYWTLQAEKSVRAYWNVYSRPDFLDFGETKQRLLNAYLQVAAQLSAHYADGRGVECDRKKAMKWLERGKRFAVEATGQQSVPPMDRAIVELQQRIREENAAQS
ncbi:MAG: sel1 repeat family protein [Oscillospiraceae bacterium]|nr:sel1 repeat family protein [Oscillospiraceae bacterium]